MKSYVLRLNRTGHRAGSFTTLPRKSMTRVPLSRWEPPRWEDIGTWRLHYGLPLPFRATASLFKREPSELSTHTTQGVEKGWTIMAASRLSCACTSRLNPCSFMHGLGCWCGRLFSKGGGEGGMPRFIQFTMGASGGRKAPDTGRPSCIVTRSESVESGKGERGTGMDTGSAHFE